MKSASLVRVLVSLTVLALAIHLFAQTTEKPELSGAIIRKSVRRVVVDAVVTDAHKKPIRGLTRQDFSVSENGTPSELPPVQLQTYALDYMVHDSRSTAGTLGFAQTPTLEFAVAAYDPDGKMLNAVVEDTVEPDEMPSPPSAPTQTADPLRQPKHNGY